MLPTAGQREEWYANFSERRLGEVRRMILPRSRVYKEPHTLQMLSRSGGRSRLG